MPAIPVKVAVKIRPLNKRESHEKECTIISDAGELKTLKLGKEGKLFTYDWVVNHSDSSREFYNNSVSGLVKGLFEGYNATVLAYGQTGSGKTYSMGTSGKMTDTAEENLGVVPRAARQIFQLIDDVEQKYFGMKHQPKIVVETQFLELYQDVIVDLYDHKNIIPPKIIQHPVEGIKVGSSVEPADSPEMIIELLQKGAANRQVGGTLMNAESSRSHAIFIINILQKLPEIEKANDESEPDMNELKAKFCLVDLAGSERLGKTGAEGGRKQEGISINKGLLSLGNVISALGSAKKKLHVNYRDTKLTFILKDSLGGNSKTLMIACISPSAGEVNETKNTLEYANRARNIKNTPKKNQDGASLQISLLKEQIEKLLNCLKHCTCGAAEGMQVDVEAEDETEETADHIEDRSTSCDPETLSATPVPPSNRSTSCTPSNERLTPRFKSPVNPAAQYQEVQSLVYLHRNEEMEATIKSLHLANKKISRQLADYKTRLDVNKIRYKVKDESEFDTKITQQLHDSHLKNEDLELEMYRRRKYYSLLDEYRKKKDVPFQRLGSQPDRMTEDILSLAQKDIDRRKMFYESLPDYILKPKPKRKRKRSKHFKMSTQFRDICPLPRQDSICLFNPSDFDNASIEALAVMHKAEELHSTIISKQFFSKRKNSRRDSGAIKTIERKGSGAFILNDHPNTSGEGLSSVQKTSLHHVEIGNQAQQEMEDNSQISVVDSLVKDESSLVSVSDHASTSGEGTMKQELEEQIDKAEQFRERKGSSRNKSESTTSVEHLESGLYSASDYADASGEVLVMMQKAEAQHQRKRDIASLKEKQDSKRLSETNSNDEQQTSLYSKSDYADASGEVLVMMQKAEAQHQRKRDIASLKEKQDSKRLSETNSNDEQQTSLYSKSDYADASGEVLVMMQKAEAQHQRKRDIASLKEKQDSKRLSETNSNDEQQTSLYSASDYADASGEVLVMMQKAEAQHQRKRDIASLKEKQDSKRLSETNSNDEQQTSLYSKSDYADASGEVLVMMQKAEAQHQRKRDIASLKEKQDSKRLSETNSNDEQQTSLYSASDYADASGEVLVMMQKAEAQHQRKRDIASLKEKQDSKRLSETISSVDQQEPSLYSASDYADASGEVLVMMQRAEAQHQRKRAMSYVKEKQDSKKLSETKSKDEQNTYLYSASDYADASGEVLVMMQKAEAHHQRKRNLASLKEKQNSKRLSETKSNDELETSLYSASDYAGPSGEVMMQNAEVQHQTERAKKLLKENEDSKREIDETTSVQQLSRTTTPPIDDPYSPDETFHKPEVSIARTTTKNSLRDLTISSNESEGSQSDQIQELHVIDEQYTEEISQQSLPKSVKISVPPEAINFVNREVRNFHFSEAHPHPEGDLISSLPEEDQAVQGELITNSVTEGATVHSKETPIEDTQNEPVYPFHLEYFSSSDRDSYETDSDFEDLDPTNPNNAIRNPDVAVVMDDINIRKGLLLLMEKDRQHNTILTKQTRGRIRELESKIQMMERDMDASKYELKECKNKLKQGDAKAKLADYEKKVLKLTNDLNEEKKLVKRKEAANKEFYIAQGAKKWKEAYEKSEVERKALSASVKSAMHKMETIRIDQAKQIKRFEKQFEKDEIVQKDKMREIDALVKKHKSEKGIANKQMEDNKKKMVAMTQECSKLTNTLKETKSTLTKKVKELTKNFSDLSAACRKEKKTTTSADKTNVKKNAPPRVPSLRESKEQSEKDRLQSVEIIEKIVTHLLNKSEFSQQIRMMVNKRVFQQLDAKKKELLKKPPPNKKSQREVYKGHGPGKDVKAILPEVKRVVGSKIPDEVATFVTPMDERRAKRALELMFLCLIYDGVVNKVKLLEEEQLNCSMNRLSESVSKMEDVKNFIKTQIVINNDNMDTTRIRRCYSMSDSTCVKLDLANNIITQDEENSSPQNSRKLKYNPVKAVSIPTTCSAIPRRLNPPTNTSTPNLKSSLIKPFLQSAFQPRPIKSINNNVPKNTLKSPSKVQSVAPHATSLLVAPPRMPVKRIVSEASSPLSPASHTLTRSTSNENSIFSPISTVSELQTLPNSSSDTNHIPLVSFPCLTSSNKRAKTPISQANSPTNMQSKSLTNKPPNKSTISYANSPTNIQSKTLTNKSTVKPTQVNTPANKQLIKQTTSQTNSPTNIQANTATNKPPNKQPSIAQANLPIEILFDSPTNTNSAIQTNNIENNTESIANNPENIPNKPQILPPTNIQPGKQPLSTKLPGKTIQTNIPASPRSSTKVSSIATPATRSIQQPRSKLFRPKQSSNPLRGVDIVKPLASCKINPRSSTLSLLLEEDSIITSDPESYIRFLDLESLKEKYCIEPKRLPGIIKKIEYRMSDQRLFVICGKKVNIFDMRTPDPIYEFNDICDDSTIIQDLSTTIDPNILYIACGTDVIVWDLVSAKCIGKFIGNTASIARIYYGIKKGNTPFLLTCCRDRSVNVYDNPEASWSARSMSIDSTSASSVFEYPADELPRLSCGSVSQDDFPLFNGYIFNKPIRAEKLLYDCLSTLTHYNDMLLFSNNEFINQYDVDNMAFVKRVDTLLLGKSCSDITNMVRFPNQPFVATTCRKGFIKFLDPIKLNLYSSKKNNYYANCQSLYPHASVMKLACNSSMIASTSSSNIHDLKLWKVNTDIFDSQ